MATKQEKYDEQQIASHWNMKFKEAMVTKADYTRRWQDYFDSYFGDYFRHKNLPEYRSNAVSNYIFSIIETIRPIMLDQNPKFEAMPRQPDSMNFVGDVQEALTYEWDREKMNLKLYRELITTLVTGNAPFFIAWNGKNKQIEAIPVNPFNLFPDPLATDVQNAEYIIYALYQNVDKLKNRFPSKASQLQGMSVNYSELVYDNNRNSRVDNQVLVLEVWSKEYDKPETYPHGRVTTLAPELGVVLDDKQNPYDDGRFPFIVFKDYDVPGKFWGEGEVQQLLSPQSSMNDLLNSIMDNAKSTANMPWVIDKNSGIPVGKITNRPGLVIRKNPGTEVRRDQPPSMPPYVQQTLDSFKGDMEQISGVFDTLKGNSEQGVYTAQGILALQEAGQARVRLKVKILEEKLGELAELWYNRMQQFWKDGRFVRITHPDGSYEFKNFQTEALKYEYDIKITAGSTMPVNRGAMLDLMTRLAQTPMPDGPLVDREAVAYYLPAEVRAPLLSRMQTQNVQLEQVSQALQQFEQQVSQALQSVDQKDQSLVKAIDQVVQGLESMSKQILQVKQQSDTLVAEQKKQAEVTRIKTDSYNTGFNDAQQLTNQVPLAKHTGGASSIGKPEGQSESDQTSQLPDDIVEGLSSMSNDQLYALLQKYPEIQQMIAQERGTSQPEAYTLGMMGTPQ